MRNYGAVPPVLSTAQPPAVSATTGLGTGGGASVQSMGSPSDGQGFGQVVVAAGLNASAGGSVTLVYATTPPTIFYAGTEAFGTLTVTGQGTTTHVLSWSTTLSSRRDHMIAYEWAVSQ